MNFDTYNQHAPYTTPGSALPWRPDAIYVGGAGTLVLQDWAGGVADYLVPAGTTIRLQTRAILEGTTATALILMRRRDAYQHGMTIETPETPELPQLPEIGTVTGGSATSGSGTFDDYLAGDLLIAFVGMGTAGDITPPSGWTRHDAERDENNLTTSIFYRYATTNGADVLGDWGSGRPRYARVRNAHPDAPFRQTVFQATASGGATIANPALPSATNGNSAVLTFQACRATAEGVAPGIRSDSTALYTRTTANGFHSTLAVSTAVPAGAWGAQSTTLTGGGTNSSGAHAWAIEVRGTPGAEEEPLFVSDATVHTTTELMAALAAVPMNLARDYVIAVASGNYAPVNIADGYTRGTTRVVLRALDPSNPPIYAQVRARGVTNFMFDGITIVHTARDAFGFPANGPLGPESLDVRSSNGLTIRDLTIRNPWIGVNFQGSKNTLLEYFLITGQGNDAIRAYTPVGDTINGLTIRRGTIRAEADSDAFPELRLHASYVKGPRIGIDPRRSDQDGYKTGQITTVTDLQGNEVSITSATRAGRHPDGIQFNGQTINVLIEDVEITGWDGYMQGIYGVSKDGPANGTLASGFTCRRVMVTIAHPNGIKLEGHNNTALLDSCVVRNFTPAVWKLNAPGGVNDAAGMRSGFTLAEQTAAVVTVVNCVRPAQYNTFWAGDANAAFTNLQSSDTALPPGWDASIIGQGRNRPLGYR